MMNTKGKILQLQHYSVNDGDGIRTIVFFAGCPLRCRWCSNPEGWEARDRILYIASRCIGCGRCTSVCPRQVGCDLNAPGERDKCVDCGACVKACLEHARKHSVTEWTVQQVLDWLEKELIFFRESGGGVTYSGGECTQQPEFLHALAQSVYDLGLNQAMETCGYFPLEKLQPTLDLMDLLFMDIKHMDREKHRQFTGVDNDLILHNIAALGRQKKNIVVRIPTIMGVNGDEENIRNTAWNGCGPLSRRKAWKRFPTGEAAGYGKNRFRKNRFREEMRRAGTFRLCLKRKKTGPVLVCHAHIIAGPVMFSGILLENEQDNFVCQLRLAVSA